MGVWGGGGSSRLQNMEISHETMTKTTFPDKKVQAALLKFIVQQSVVCLYLLFIYPLCTFCLLITYVNGR
jgi:hypothetical protein